MKNISTDELGSFVAFVDTECKGRLNDPKVAAKYFPLNLVYKTIIDESIDPFSDEYFQSQLNLYEEIAGRKLDQHSGELHSVNVDDLLNRANPQGSHNADQISENVRAISTLLSFASLGEKPQILDMGAGHGMSSEIFAFCGCTVHAIDIDPMLAELSLKRAANRSLNISRSVMNFDSITELPNNFYDAAFFFQSLHHALRPWDLIAELKQKLNDKGVIAFSGEPIQERYFKHWGIRLDEESIYVAKKFGWFESGWSQKFIVECFNRNGLQLVLLGGGHGGGLMGIASKDSSKLDQILKKATLLGFSTVNSVNTQVSLTAYKSQIGTLQPNNKLRPTIKANVGHPGGFLCFGPYISLPAGCYRVSFLADLLDDTVHQKPNPIFVFDVVSDSGKITHYKENVFLEANNPFRLVVAEFELSVNARLLETRVRVPEGAVICKISLPVIEQISNLSNAFVADTEISKKEAENMITQAAPKLTNEISENVIAQAAPAMTKETTEKSVTSKLIEVMTKFKNRHDPAKDVSRK